MEKNYTSVYSDAFFIEIKFTTSTYIGFLYFPFKETLKMKEDNLNWTRATLKIRTQNKLKTII